MLHSQAKQGAARQSWNKNNPRSILDQLMIDHPKIKKDDLYQLMWDKIKSNKAIYESMFEYWFANNTRTQVTFQDRQENKKQINYLVEKMLLKLPLPNGKLLGDATGEECAKAGGFYFRVSTKVPAQEKVGKVLDEKQLAKIYKEDK